MGVLRESEIERVYFAECAHRLTAGVPERHMCRRLHGHTYEIRLFIEGRLQNGMVIEYGDLDRVVRPIILKVDHWDLNSLHERCSSTAAAEVSANPTVEHLAGWLGDRLWPIIASSVQGGGLRLARVRVQEGADERAAAWWRPEA